MEQSLTKEELIYRNDGLGVKVYRGVFRSNPVAIKCQLFASVGESNAALREGFAATKIGHQCVCKVHDCIIEQVPEGFEVVLVTEWMEGGDVMVNIKRRAQTAQYWSNEELRYHLYQLTEVFAKAQEMGICHRDIKPQNLLCDANGFIKISDFGSSLFNRANEGTHTLRGSPFYLSPELKMSYVRSRGLVHQVAHDPYRSDVYSLGLTFLHMAKLKEPTELLDLENLQQQTDSAIQQLQVADDIKSFLAWMLRVDSRPDFKELYAYMKEYYNPTAQIVAVERVEEAKWYGVPETYYQYPPAVAVAQPVGYEAVGVQSAEYRVADVQPVEYRDGMQSVEYGDAGMQPMGYGVAQDQSGPEGYQYAVEQSVEVQSRPFEAPVNYQDCIGCQGRNGPKKWRIYMPKSYKIHSDKFDLVCSPDCLDKWLSQIEEEEKNKPKAEMADNLCAFCKKVIPDRNKVADTLACNHDVCSWKCFFKELQKSGRTIKCGCGNTESQRGLNKILNKCKSPRNRMCLLCYENTDLTARCEHPICLECSKSDGCELSGNCPYCLTKRK